MPWSFRLPISKTRPTTVQLLAQCPRSVWRVPKVLEQNCRSLPSAQVLFWIPFSAALALGCWSWQGAVFLPYQKKWKGWVAVFSDKALSASYCVFCTDGALSQLQAFPFTTTVSAFLWIYPMVETPVGKNKLACVKTIRYCFRTSHIGK